MPSPTPIETFERALQRSIRRRSVDRSIPVGQKFTETRDFVIGQTGQCRTLAGDSRFRAEIDQLFTVELQLFS